jgi:signal transduction histidine kinase
MRRGRPGLLGIRERVRELGGSLQIQSTPGHGTVLTAEFPLHEPSGDITTELTASEVEAS